MLNGKFPTLLGLLLLIVQLVVGMLFIQNKRIVDLTQRNFSTPKEIRISNLSENGFTVSWITDKKTNAEIIIGENPGKLNKLIEDKEKTIKTYTHSINIKDLQNDKTYYYQIISDGYKFLNEGKPWQINTLTKIDTIPKSVVLKGNVVKNNSEPVDGALVFVTVNGSSLLSTTTDSNGHWSINLAEARNQKMNEYQALTVNKTPIEVYVHSGIWGFTYARAALSENNVLKTMNLGDIYTFTTGEEEDFGTIPKASINI